MTTRLPVDRMPGLLRQPHPDVPLGIYRHARTDARYLVAGGTFLATGEDQLVFVHYVSLRDGYSAHRTVEDFLEPVRDPATGDDTTRFVLLRQLPESAVHCALAMLLATNLHSRGLGAAFGKDLEHILILKGGGSWPTPGPRGGSDASDGSPSATPAGGTGTGPGS